MNSSVKTAYRALLAFWAAMLLASVWPVGTAFAGEPVRAETVKFQDLNVDTSEGVRALYRRIHAAARRVCYTNGSDPLYQRRAVDCASKAEAEAIETVNLPQLTSFYRLKTGSHTQPLSANR